MGDSSGQMHGILAITQKLNFIENIYKKLNNFEMDGHLHKFLSELSLLSRRDWKEIGYYNILARQLIHFSASRTCFMPPQSCKARNTDSSLPSTLHSRPNKYCGRGIRMSEYSDNSLEALLTAILATYRVLEGTRKFAQRIKPQIPRSVLTSQATTLYLTTDVMRSATLPALINIPLIGNANEQNIGSAEGS